MLNLTPQEIKDVTGKTHRKSQIIVLIGMSIPFKVRPDGSILISREAYQLAMGAEQVKKTELTKPDFSSFNVAS